ncbi:MAG TPA: NAD(P)H-hydrate dehydratase [Chloroflexota bacterium]|nr:NAD(P)H-hydrate dehydratase [Chloroflexota bacterium]
MRVVSVEEMRDLEARTFGAGTSETALQERAGRAVADAIMARHPSPGRAVALVGPGNNGRDASIAARELLAAGWEAALALGPRHSVTDAELERFGQSGGQVVWLPERESSRAVEGALFSATVAIDGLLGIGASGSPRPPLAAMVEAVNAVRTRMSGLDVVSVDVPSGLNADTGEATLAVRADATVVLGGMKRGLLASSALAVAGDLIPADIGVVDGPPTAPVLLTRGTVRGLLARPRPDAHKGTFGRLLVVAGSESYVGAAYLVCAAAVRVGAGIVTLAATRTLRDVVASRLPEATYLLLPDGGMAGCGAESASLIAQALPRYTALAIGPGLSTAGGVPSAVEAVLRARAQHGVGAVVDADALNALSGRPGWHQWLGHDVVMTPHLGELARLTGRESGDEAPWAKARRLADAWGATLLIKGACTAIASSRGVWVHARPNPALGTAGTGDVLTGTIGGLLARGLDVDAAARLGAWVHGEAGARAALGRRAGGLMASELLAEIPAVLATTLAG